MVVSLFLPFGPSLPKIFRPPGFRPAGFGLATTASADFSLHLRCRPFRREARSPRVRVDGFPRTAAGFTHRLFDRGSFVVPGPPPPSHPAHYPFPVRRPGIFLPVFFSPALAAGRPPPLLRLAVRYGPCG